MFKKGEMNMRMRQAMVLKLICIIMLVLSACAPDRAAQLSGNTNNNGGGNKGAVVQEQGSGEDEIPDKLIVWSNDDAKHLTAVEQLAGEFTAKTGVAVEIVPVSGSEQVQKLALAAPAGNGPDLFYQPQDRLGDIVVQGLAAPVELSEQELAE